MNRCIFSGRTTSDIEIRHGQNTVVGSFTLAVDGGKDASGNQTTDFLNCSVFGDTAERMEKWVRKGTKILIEARAKQDKWKDRDGNNRSAIKFTVSYWEFAESKNASENQTAQKTDKDGFMDATQLGLEDLPFN